jgi:hypothetical protein
MIQKPLFESRLSNLSSHDIWRQSVGLDSVSWGLISLGESRLPSAVNLSVVVFTMSCHRKTQNLVVSLKSTSYSSGLRTGGCSEGSRFTFSRSLANESFEACPLIPLTPLTPLTPFVATPRAWPFVREVVSTTFPPLTASPSWSFMFVNRYREFRQVLN